MLSPERMQQAVGHAKELQVALSQIDPKHPEAKQQVHSAYHAHLQGGKTLLSERDLNELVRRTELGMNSSAEHRSQFEFEMFQYLARHLVHPQHHSIYTELTKHWLDASNVRELFSSLHLHRQTVLADPEGDRTELIHNIQGVTKPAGRSMERFQRFCVACNKLGVEMSESWHRQLERVHLKPAVRTIAKLPFEPIIQSARALRRKAEDEQHKLMSEEVRLVHTMNRFVIHGLGTKRIMDQWRDHE